MGDKGGYWVGLGDIGAYWVILGQRGANLYGSGAKWLSWVCIVLLWVDVDEKLCVVVMDAA